MPGVVAHKIYFAPPFQRGVAKKNLSAVTRNHRSVLAVLPYLGGRVPFDRAPMVFSKWGDY